MTVPHQYERRTPAGPPKPARRTPPAETGPARPLSAKYPERADIKTWVLRIAYLEDPPAGYVEKLLEIGDEAQRMGIKVFLHPIRG